MAPANAAAVLYGVTGDGAAVPETLFTINTTTATSTVFLPLGAGNDGEAIAYNPDDGLMYHASGYNGGEVWESIDLSIPAVVSSTGIGTGCSGIICEVTALVYAGAGMFLASDLNSSLLSISSAGVVVSLGTLPETLKGLAFLGGTLYGAGRSSTNIYALNATTGAVLATHAITLAGGFSGFNGLATNPDSNTLWAVTRNGSSRSLVTIDLSTNTASAVGTLSDNFAGIAFVGDNQVSIPAPGALALFGLGLLALGAARRRR
jgi:hypothetical protein